MISIIYNHVHPSNVSGKVNVKIYYRKFTIKNLLIKTSRPRVLEAKNHCVYSYTCDERQCNLYDKLLLRYPNYRIHAVPSEVKVLWALTSHVIQHGRLKSWNFK